MKKTHEQFLEDLWNRNKHYRDGMFEVIGQYECDRCKIELNTKFGKCLIIPNSLLVGTMPNISSAINRAEYFKSMCYDKFGDNNDDLSDAYYCGSGNKIKIKCKVTGECYSILPHTYLSGIRSRSSFKLRVSELNSADKDVVFSKIKDMHPDLEIISEDYESMHKKILVKAEFGICQIQPANLLQGQSVSIKSAINPTDYWINMVTKVHGNKYDYSKVNYTNNYTKVLIINKDNGNEFWQNPGDHLSKKGCPIEGKEKVSKHQKDNPTGWSYSHWSKSAYKSKFFSGFKLYFLECYSDDEKFYKIGRTYMDVKRRFKGKHNMPYQYNILHTIELDDPKRICELEQELKNKHKEFKYIPKIKFGGMHECFSSININD